MLFVAVETDEKKKGGRCGKQEAVDPSVSFRWRKYVCTQADTYRESECVGKGGRR